MSRVVAADMNTSDGLLARVGTETTGYREVHGATLITTGGGGVVYLRDGSGSGKVMASLTTTAAGAITVIFPSAISFPQGCYIDVVSGTVDAASSVLVGA